MGEDLREILQDSSNEEHMENKHNQGSKVEIEKMMMRLKKVHFKVKMMAEKTGSTINQTFPYKSGTEWRQRASLVIKKKICEFQKWSNYLSVRK